MSELATGVALAGSISLKPIDLVVMDWGIGGLSVYNEIVKKLPSLSILYLSDSGQTPYGKMPRVELKSRVFNIVEHFSKKGCKHFVIACNAASTVLPLLEKDFARLQVRVTGVIEHGTNLVKSTSYKRVGIIGGKRTIRSRCYVHALGSKDRKITGRVAQPLSALIESGELTSELMTKTLVQILKPLKNCDALLMACTHYPAVKNQMQQVLPATRLLDPAPATAAYIKKHWRLSGFLKKGQTSFFTSGSKSEMRKAAKAAFGVSIGQIQSLSV